LRKNRNLWINSSSNNTVNYFPGAAIIQSRTPAGIEFEDAPAISSTEGKIDDHHGRKQGLFFSIKAVGLPGYYILVLAAL
jgi:hypothetical protein